VIIREEKKPITTMNSQEKKFPGPVASIKKRELRTTCKFSSMRSAS